ncbi:MAG: 50S ribosomal protein L18 [Actinomycetota bacterium]|nr:50S ribosomal protein L18 [Actinomycetota bacterium]
MASSTDSRRKRHRRVRKHVVGTPERPRLAVFRSNRHIYAQIIDDVEGRTLAAASTLKDGEGEDPRARAKAVGVVLAGRAKEAEVTHVAFDRGGFMYHGRIQAVAEGAREGGLDF